MDDWKNSLTPKQHAAIDVLLTAPTIRAAAEILEVEVPVLYTWLAEPDFIAAYRRVGRIALGQSLARLQRAASAAVTVLVEALDSSDRSTSPRVAAARAVLELSIKAVELEELEERVTALEEARV